RRGKERNAKPVTQQQEQQFHWVQQFLAALRRSGANFDFGGGQHFWSRFGLGIKKGLRQPARPSLRRQPGSASWPAVSSAVAARRSSMRTGSTSLPRAARAAVHNRGRAATPA